MHRCAGRRDGGVACLLLRLAEVLQELLLDLACRSCSASLVATCSVLVATCLVATKSVLVATCSGWAQCVCWLVWSGWDGNGAARLSSRVGRLVVGHVHGRLVAGLVYVHGQLVVALCREGGHEGF